MHFPFLPAVSFFVMSFPVTIAVITSSKSMFRASIKSIKELEVAFDFGSFQTYQFFLALGISRCIKQVVFVDK